MRSLGEAPPLLEGQDADCGAGLQVAPCWSSRSELLQDSCGDPGSSHPALSFLGDKENQE